MLPSLLFFSFFLFQIQQVSCNSNVKTKLNSSWKQTSLIAEISEFLGRESNEKFWEFYQNFYENVPDGFDSSSDKEKYDFGLKIASGIINEADINLLKISIATRKFSPLVETHYQLGSQFKIDDCTEFYVYRGKASCELDYQDFERGDEEKIYNFDHILPNSGASSKVLIIYGDFGTRSYRKLVQDANKKGFKVIVRHFKKNQHPSMVSLSGYGVELSLKNSEYTVIDGNINNTSYNGEEKNKKQWNYEKLGHSTFQKIIDSSSPLDLIQDLSQNFPSHVDALDSTKIRETTYEKIEKLWNELEESGIYPGENRLSINGKVIARNGDHEDVFNMLDVLRNERTLSEMGTKFGFNDEDAQKIWTSLDLSKSPIRTAFDYRKAEPRFLNDLEQRHGFSDLRNLAIGAPLNYISLNVFTIIIFVNPFEENPHFDEALILAQNYAPFRIGVVLTHPDVENIGFDEISPVFNVISTIFKVKRPQDLLEYIKTGNRFLESTGLKNCKSMLNGYPLNVIRNNNFQHVLNTEFKLQYNILFKNLEKILKYDQKIEDWWISDTNSDLVEKTSMDVTTAFENGDFIEIFDGIEGIVETFGDKSIWIVADFGSKNGRDLASEARKAGIIPVFIPRTSCDELTIDLLSINDKELSGKSGEKCAKLLELARKLKIENDVIIANGLKIPTTNFKVDDFQILEKVWKTRGITDISLKIGAKGSIFVAEVSKLFGDGEKRRAFSKLENSLMIPRKFAEKPAISVIWVVNPLSRAAQHQTSLIRMISEVMNAEIQIILNIDKKIAKLPIDRFYRFVLPHEPKFDTENGRLLENSAIFTNLPKNQLLTMGIVTNEAWMIEIKEAKYDLDNILMDSDDVEAVYSLENILVEGACLNNEEPASGLEIEIVSGRWKRFDTIVMLNLGYFQLKASPGIWKIQIREGPSSENFEFENDDLDAIVVDSFSSKWHRIAVKEGSKLQEPDVPSMYHKVINYFGFSEKSILKNTLLRRETINVFSVVSGHLYERFLRIMMLSVVKNTKSSNVKFWLLKNYLSPQFKKSIGRMAEKYGFEYELVEYKWPEWLNRQEEKQRIMWGYKILFLDVLFPLNIEKVIFVDADQVVRADLQELVDLPLDGAPYGYVPFCESRTEMDGFRFWTSGYWKKHMKHRKYHISALYVIDLKKFREISAGDRLRGRYASLSNDPNSLSNLDQDLPNNMIHEVEIKSLPQEWLWCETWCDDGSKNKAKTIDLCNNPLTKEPKLKSAARIIDEWKDYDAEISSLLENEKPIHDDL